MIPQPLQLKLVLVGESSVGKSSILSRFVDDQFHQSQLLTIGVDFKFRKFKVDNQFVKLQIWDTAGQQKFRSISGAYYNSSDAIVIVYDITSFRTLQSVKQYWIGQAKNNNKNNACIFIVGNKLDEAANKREVQAHNVEFAVENNPVDKTFQVSAKTGANIEQCFEQICRVVIKKKKAIKDSEGQIAQQKNTHLSNEMQLASAKHKSSLQGNKCCKN